MSNDTQPEIRFPGFTDDWEQRKLGDVVKFYSGLTYSPDNVQEEGTFVLRSSNVKNGEIVDADNVYVSHDVINSDNVQEGDLIVVVRNGSRDLIGKHAQIKQQMDNTVIGAFMTGVRSETPDFTNALLDTQQFAIEISKNLGATINQITTGAFKKMQFVVSKDKDERESIGTFFRSIDDTIALHQRKLDLLKETKKGFLQKMFPKNGAKVPEVRFPGFTEDWEQRKLGDESDVRDGTHDSPKYYDKGYPLVTSKNLKDFGLDLTNVSFISDEDFEVINKRSKVDIGDILFGMIGTIGNPVLVDRVDFAIKNVALIKEQKKILNSFLIQILKSPVFDKYINNENAGGTQKFLSLSKVRDFNFLCPNIDEQNCISAFFKQLDDTIALHQRKLDLLKETKKGFLQKMFV